MRLNRTGLRYRPHQREVALCQSDRSIAQIAHLPGAIEDALLGEQRCNDAIAATDNMRVEHPPSGFRRSRRRLDEW